MLPTLERWMRLLMKIVLREARISYLLDYIRLGLWSLLRAKY